MANITTEEKKFNKSNKDWCSEHAFHPITAGGEKERRALPQSFQRAESLTCLKAESERERGGGRASALVGQKLPVL